MTCFETDPAGMDAAAYTVDALSARITTVLEEGRYLSDDHLLEPTIAETSSMPNRMTTPGTTIVILGAGIESEYTFEPDTDQTKAENARLEAYLNRTRRGELAEPVGLIAMFGELGEGYASSFVSSPGAPMADRFHNDMAEGRDAIVVNHIESTRQVWELMHDDQGPLPVLRALTVGLRLIKDYPVVPVQEHFRLTEGLTIPMPRLRL